MEAKGTGSKVWGASLVLPKAAEGLAALNMAGGTTIQQ